MSYLKKHFNLLAVLPLLLWATVFVGEYKFVPVGYMCFLLGFFVLHVLYALFAVKFKNCAGTISRTLGILNPIVLTAGTVFLLAVIERDGIYSKSSAVCAVSLLPITLITTLIVFSFYTEYAWVKITIGVASGLVLGIYAVACTAYLFSSWFVGVEVSREVKSPDDNFVIEVITYDEGALGGSTKVCLKGTDEIFVGAGTLIKRSYAIRHGRWSQVYEICWKDNETFVIDGEEYCVRDY